MPHAVTAFSVKIASPSEEAIESIIVREVICNWNAHHALLEKRVLLPIYGLSARALAASDLLVDFFSDSGGEWNEHDFGSEEAEIEKHLALGKPALVYFSEARGDLKGGHHLEKRALDGFQKRFAAATLDSYGDEKEFRAKFTRHLESTLTAHAYFRTEPPAVEPVTEPTPAPAPILSERARLILVEACDDFEAYIGRIKIGTMLRIQANGKQLVEPGDAASTAKWEAAFEELLQAGYIRDVGCNGQLFQISAPGFEYLKSIGKTPVGYIAELGGM